MNFFFIIDLYIKNFFLCFEIKKKIMEISAKITGNQKDSCLVMNFPPNYLTKNPNNPNVYNMSIPQKFSLQFADGMTYSNLDSVDVEDKIQLVNLSYSKNKQTALRIIWFTVIGAFKKIGCNIDTNTPETTFQVGGAFFRNNPQRNYTINQLRLYLRNTIGPNVKFIKANSISGMKFQKEFILDETIDLSNQWAIENSKTKERLVHKEFEILYCEHEFEKGELTEYLQNKNKNEKLCFKCE